MGLRMRRGGRTWRLPPSDHLADWGYGARTGLRRRPRSALRGRAWAAALAACSAWAGV